MSIRSLLALGAAEPILRELRYCRWNGGWAWRFADTGPIGRAQAHAERQGWLTACPIEPRRLRLTETGRRAIDRLEMALAPSLAPKAKRSPGRSPPAMARLP